MFELANGLADIVGLAVFVQSRDEVFSFFTGRLGRHDDLGEDKEERGKEGGTREMKRCIGSRGGAPRARYIGCNSSTTTSIVLVLACLLVLSRTGYSFADPRLVPWQLFLPSQPPGWMASHPVFNSPTRER